MYANIILVILLISGLIFSGCSRGAEVAQTSPAAERKTIETPAAPAAPSDAEFNGVRLSRSEDEWRSMLTPAEYHVLREEGTERAYTGEYDKNKEAGVYYCRACRLELFSSVTKFESGTGWPSFYEPITAKNVVEVKDSTLGMERIEVECARCGSHLGHVFDDGPKPTGLRYCINSISLKFRPAGE